MDKADPAAPLLPATQLRERHTAKHPPGRWIDEDLLALLRLSAVTAIDSNVQFRCILTETESGALPVVNTAHRLGERLVEMAGHNACMMA